MEVWANGDVTFRPDDTGVERISPGGSLTIEQQWGLTTHRLDARPAPNGSVVYSYSVNGDPQRFDATAQRAFAGLLLTVIRQTGIGAEVRIARILTREGVDGVFAEIDRIERSSASARYLQELLEQGNLDTVQLARLADEIGEQLSSSAAKSRLLTSALPYVQAVPTDDPNADATRSAYFEAIDSISSSADRARVLRQVLHADHLETATLTRVARSAEGISSSAHKARVLSGMTAHYTNDSQLRDAFFDAADSISSSSHRSRVLIALLDADSVDKTSLAALLEAVRSISSSGDKTKVLVTAAGHLSGDANLVSRIRRWPGASPRPATENEPSRRWVALRA